MIAFACRKALMAVAEKARQMMVATIMPMTLRRFCHFLPLQPTVWNMLQKPWVRWNHTAANQMRCSSSTHHLPNRPFSTGSPRNPVLPNTIINAIEDCGFFESIPLWAVTLIGGLFIWVLSFIMILSVYGRFFKMYMYTAIAPIPLSSFAGEPSQNIGKSFLKSYAAVLLEGAIIVLACIIFSVFASSPPVVDPNAAAASMVWSYIGELIFNMLILVASV